MIKNVKREIIRSFLFHRKYIVWVAMTCLLSSFLFSVYCIVQETNTYNEIDEIKSDYGTYTYKLYNLTPDKVQVVKEDDTIKSYLFVKTKYIDVMDETFQYMAVSEQFFEYSNYSIVQGNYPKNKNEVMVPKWYLYQLGIKPDSMIGSRIKIPNPNTGEMESKVVSGLVVINKENFVMGESDNSNFILFGEEFVDFKDSLQNAYVITEKLGQYEKDMNRLMSNIDDKNVLKYQVNYTLLCAYGYTDAGNVAMFQQKAMYFGIIILIVLLVGILMSNVLTVCLEKWKTILGVYKIIGADMMQIKMNILLLFLVAICVGTISGSLLGIGGVYIYVHIYSLHMKLPIGWLVLEGFLVLLLFVRMLSKKLEDYAVKTAQEVVTERKFRIDEFLNKRVLFRRERFGIIKLSFRNFLVYNRKKMISILSIAFCIVVLFTIRVQFEEKIDRTDNNDEYKYYVEVADYFDVNTNASKKEMKEIINICEQIRELCTENGCTVYYESGHVDSFKMPKSKLSKEYIAKLNKTVNGQVCLKDSRDYINEQAVIMGYSQEMVQELAKKQNLDIDKLEPDQAIILSRNTNMDGKGGSSILPMTGESFEIDTLLYGGKEYCDTNKYTIVADFDELSVYPDYNKNTICIIIDIDQYNKYFNMGYASSFYLKDMDEGLLDKIQHLLQGNTYVKLTNQEDKALAEKVGYQKRMLLMALVLALCCFFTVINIQVQNIFEFDYRKPEFELLKTIGMPQRKKYSMIALETAYIFLLGLITGVIICKMIQGLLYHFCIINSPNTGMDFIVSGIGVVCIFMISSICLTCRKMK